MASMGVLPSMSLLFSLATFAPQIPWTIMTIFPRAEFTRKLMAPLAVPVLSCAIHFAVDYIGFQQADAAEELAKFAGVFDFAHALDGTPLRSFNSMLENPNFVTEEWAHVLAWDIFVGRWILLDGLARDVPLLRLSLLTCNFTGPPGLLLHLAVSLVSGKGLPSLEFAEGKDGGDVVLLPSVPRAESAGALVRALYSDAKGPRADVTVSACADDVVWDDMCAPNPVKGRSAVYKMLKVRNAADDAAGAMIVPERFAEGEKGAGLTWHRSKEGVDKRGLRGTTYVELDDDGRIVYVREGAEPILKPGDATAVLLKAVAEQAAKEAAVERSSRPELTQRTPDRVSDIVPYLWQEVQSSSTDVPSESIRFFSDEICYEDLNYELPFVGRDSVRSFLDEFNVPGLTFNLLRWSDGADSCVFCWEVDLGMGEDADRVQGISFYGGDGKGGIQYVRDIPAPTAKPPPLQELAAKFDPALRVFQPSPMEASAVELAKSKA
ncbi:DUF4281 domain-containing protein [Pycnococcus provasolii]